MQVLSKIPLEINPNYIDQHLQSSLQDVSPLVVDHVSDLIAGQTTVVLFSGGHRLPWDAVYIEAKMFADAQVAWKSQTIFIDPSNQPLLEYTIKKLNCDNLVIVNNNIFLKYRIWSDIMYDIQQLRHLTGRVIVTMPLCRFDYNRLRYSQQDMARIMGGIVLDHTMVVCQ
jgi:hypothetical protein